MNSETNPTQSLPDSCVICAEEGEPSMFNLRGRDGTLRAGRILLAGSVLCNDHAEEFQNAVQND
jgi:hypothetical protein